MAHPAARRGFPSHEHQTHPSAPHHHFLVRICVTLQLLLSPPVGSFTTLLRPCRVSVPPSFDISNSDSDLIAFSLFASCQAINGLHPCDNRCEPCTVGCIARHINSTKKEQAASTSPRVDFRPIHSSAPARLSCKQTSNGRAYLTACYSPSTPTPLSRLASAFKFIILRPPAVLCVLGGRIPTQAVQAGIGDPIALRFVGDKGLPSSGLRPIEVYLKLSLHSSQGGLSFSFTIIYRVPALHHSSARPGFDHTGLSVDSAPEKKRVGDPGRPGLSIREPTVPRWSGCPPRCQNSQTAGTEKELRRTWAGTTPNAAGPPRGLVKSVFCARRSDKLLARTSIQPTSPCAPVASSISLPPSQAS